jgi:hypothetical protein
MSIRAARTISCLMILATTVLTLTAPAVASPGQPVTITLLSTIDPPDAVDPFTSTGGIVCATGEVSTVRTVFAGGQSGFHAQITTVKHFECANGSFDLLVRVTLDEVTFNTEGTWTVLRGTGAFAKLHGSGSITGTRVGDKVLDEYIGSMHIN